MATYKDVTLQSKDGSTNYYPHTEASLVVDAETKKTVKEQLDTLGTAIESSKQSIAELNREIYGFKNVPTNQGNVDGTSGKINPAARTRVTTNLYNDEVTFKCDDGYRINTIHRYKISELNADFLLDRLYDRKSEATIAYNEEYPYYNITFEKVNNTELITPTEAEEHIRIVVTDSITQQISEIKNEASKSTEKVTSIGEKIGVVILDMLKGNISQTGMNASVASRTTTSLFSRPIRVICSNDVQINVGHAFKYNPLIPTTKGEGFIELPATNRKDCIFYPTEEFPYINVTFQKDVNTEPLTPEYAKENVKITYDGDNLYNEVASLEKAVKDVVEVGNATYYGEIQNIQISEKKHKMNISTVLSHTASEVPDTLHNQSMAIFNNYFFCFNDTSYAADPFCVIIDMATKEIVDSVMVHPSEIGSSHVNNACFTNKYYSPTDQYPLILISRGDYPNGTDKGKEMYIYRIAENNHKFTFTHIKTISLEKFMFGSSWEYDATRNMIWGHVNLGGDWRWGSPSYRLFNNNGLYFAPDHDAEYICIESNEVASISAHITIQFSGNTTTVKEIDVAAGNKLRSSDTIFPYTKNVGGYGYIRVNQSASAFAGQYTVYACDVNGENRVPINYRCAIVGFDCPDLTDSASVEIPNSEVTSPVFIDNVIYQGGCCHNGKIYLPVQSYTTINGQDCSYKGHCCFVVSPQSGHIETQIPTDSIENEGCAIYDGSLYISCHVGNATGSAVSFKIIKIDFS